MIGFFGQKSSHPDVDGMHPGGFGSHEHGQISGAAVVIGWSGNLGQKHGSMQCFGRGGHSFVKPGQQHGQTGPFG